MNDVDWLRLKNRGIWKPENSTHDLASPSHLTVDDLRRVIAIAEQRDLLITLYNACAGVGLGCDVSSMAPYPGAPPITALSFTSDHLACPAGTSAFDHAWETLSPVAFAPRNLRLYRFQYGCVPPQDKAYYETA